VGNQWIETLHIDISAIQGNLSMNSYVQVFDSFHFNTSFSESFDKRPPFDAILGIESGSRVCGIHSRPFVSSLSNIDLKTAWPSHWFPAYYDSSPGL
jgi:hypothetical protein